jgi:hypothetical protein
MASTSRI